MKIKAVFASLACLLVFAFAAAGAAQASPQTKLTAECPSGQGFTYQGRLTQDGRAAEGSFDFQFRLYDAPDSGAVMTTVFCDNVPVSGGLFTVGLGMEDLPNLSAIYIATSVRPAGASGYVDLMPRQMLGPVPFASYADHISAPLTLSGEASPLTQGVLTVSGSNGQYALYAQSTGMPAIFAISTGTYAAQFAGSINVIGTVVETGTILQLPHPLDPRGKTLNLAAPASPELLTTLSGNATLDTQGQAEVAVPEWFEAGNTDFRYTLTPVGAAAPGLYIASEVAHGSFHIAGGAAGMKVSWQVSGVRKDAYAQAHPLMVEQAAPSEGQQP